MEVISPQFVAVNLPGIRPGPPLSASAASLPLRFIITGLAALAAGILLLLIRPDLLAAYHYNQYILSVTHLLVLGWILSICMGAVYQLIPVALETELFSRRLAKWQFVFHSVGVAGMVWSFWTWNMPQLGQFASLMAVGILLFIYNMARTLARVGSWNTITIAFAAALFWLFLAVAAGLLLAADKIWKFSRFDPIAQMHAHLYLGVAGFVLMLLVGASFKLIPMFALSDIQSPTRAAAALFLVNVGLASATPAILWQSHLKFLFGCILASGFLLYLWELRSIFAARKRKTLDWGLKSFSTALTLLVPVCAIGLVLAWPSLPLNNFTGQLENAYGFLALLGIISMAVLGMLSKILPFLVWHNAYSHLIGRYKVPAPSELVSPLLQACSYYLYTAGLVSTTAAILLENFLAVRLSLSLLAASIGLFAVNAGLALRHWIRPRIDVLPARRPGQPHPASPANSPSIL